MRSLLAFTQIAILAVASFAALVGQLPQDPPAPAEQKAPKCELIDNQNSPMELRSNKTENTWTIASPNGQHKIILTAANDGASIWISGEREAGMIGLVHGFKLPGPVVGIYAPGKNQQVMSAALAAYSPGGGELQLCPSNAPPRFLDSRRLEEVQNLIYPPAKEPEAKAEPAEQVPLRE